MTQEQIIQAVAEVFDITTEQLLSKSRKQAIADAKKVAQFFCYFNDYEVTLKQIAKIWNVDHTDISHNITGFMSRVKTEPCFAELALAVSMLIGELKVPDLFPTIYRNMDKLVLYTEDYRLEYPVSEYLALICPVYRHKKRLTAALSRKNRIVSGVAIPTTVLKRDIKRARVNQVVALLDAGFERHKLFKMFNLDTRSIIRVNRILADNRREVLRLEKEATKATPPIVDKYESIYHMAKDMYGEGIAIGAIARHFGITQYRVEMIIAA